MRLKSLEMHGFKSFPDRTRINFTSGVTVIVGPNGSGKSNVSDAIRWVLGELSSKNVRGNKMEDVIFGGTEKRSPMGYAEVSLTIDNSGENRINVDYDEITVTRRLYRSGDSEYLINNKTSRLRDILDMFLNTGIGKTGYSIIGQGKISEIISQKSEERRIIFEEAAGISKYRIKKQEAERRLRDTDDNLTRLNDILSEIESRVGPLEKEAAKAKIYLELYEKKKAIEVSLLLYDIAKVNADREIIERDYLVAKQELDIVEEAIASLDARIEHLTELQTEKRMAFEDYTSQHARLNEEKHSAINELTLAKNELLHLDNTKNQSIDAYEREKQHLALRKGDKEKLSAELADNQAQLARLADEYNETEYKLNSQRQIIADLSNEIEALEKENNARIEKYNELRVSISAEDATKNSSAARQDEIAEEIESTKERLLSLENKKKRAVEALKDYQDRVEVSQSRLTTLLAECKSKEDQLSAKNRECTALLSEIAAKQQRVDALKRMEEHFEGYSRSVKFVADSASSGRLSGICGPVSKLISVDEHLSLAIETALGANIQNIIVENEEAAKAAISLLKRENAGRATFYPLTSIKASSLSVDMSRLSRSNGFIGVASSLIRFDSKYAQVIGYLLGKTVIFDNLDNASEAARLYKYSFKAVTLDGQIINAGGSFTGGSAKRDSGILTRGAEIASIVSEKNALEEKLEKLTMECRNLEKEIKEIHQDADSLSSDIALISALLKAEETSLGILEQNIADEEQKLESFTSSLEMISVMDKEKKDRLEALIGECDALALEIKDAERLISDRQNELENAEQTLSQLISSKNSAYLSCSLKTRDIENIKSRVEETDNRITELESEVARLEELISDIDRKSHKLSERVSELEKAIKEHEEALCELEESKAAVNSESIELEKDINELRLLSRDKTNKKIECSATCSALGSKLERISSDKDKLTEKLYEEYELTYASAQELEYEPVTEENRSKKGSELSKYKSKIRELGSVNVNAIEEYKEVKERYEFLSEQIGDLNKSKNEFNEIIGSLEIEMCQMFSTTFAKINENFKEVFSQLFGGGSANLSLSDPENVLTSGIEIEVAPPGKIIKNLKLLSGGEQVFVAIAIFFAILKVNPSPFCLLDEIESALDEVNVDRFAAYAKLYSENTQFIIITHRRGSMEAADTIYGITMQEKGISKVLSVNMNEIEQKTGVKL